MENKLFKVRSIELDDVNYDNIVDSCFYVKPIMYNNGKPFTVRKIASYGNGKEIYQADFSRESNVSGFFYEKKWLIFEKDPEQLFDFRF